MRGEIYKIARKHKAEKVYVFGSCARGEETPDSDIDFLVELQKGVSFRDLLGLQDGFEKLLGCSVDVVSKNGLSPFIRNSILSEAVLL
jgi:predicted nucleotidyltransferase